MLQYVTPASLADALHVHGEYESGARTATANTDPVVGHHHLKFVPAAALVGLKMARSSRPIELAGRE